MGWNYAVLEVHCFFPMDEDENSKFGPPPPYCKYGIGNSGVHCMVGDNTILNENAQEPTVPCPYAGYGQAETTVVLTNGEGECIASDSFWSDETLSVQEWNRRKKEWIETVRLQTFNVAKIYSP